MRQIFLELEFCHFQICQHSTRQGLEDFAFPVHSSFFVCLFNVNKENYLPNLPNCHVLGPNISIWNVPGSPFIVLLLSKLPDTIVILLQLSL